MPSSPGSGYEQILAARGELRTRADRAVSNERRASAEPAAAARPAAPAAHRSLERPPERPGGLDRRDRPALLVWGLLTAPAACVLFAFTWVGSPRSPVPSAAAPVASRTSLPIIVGAGSVAPTPLLASEGELVIAARDAPQVHPWPDDAEPVPPLGNPWLRPMPNGLQLESVFDALAGGSESAQESAPSGELPSSPDMLPEEVRAAFATWDRHTSPRVSDDGPGTGPAEGGPVSAARGRDAPAAEAGPGSGMPADDWAPLTVVGAAPDAEPTRDDPAEAEAAAEAASDPAPPSVATILGAVEPASHQEKTLDVPASAGSRDRDAAEATEPSPPVKERQQAFAALHDPAGQPPEAALSSAGTDAAADAEASGGSPAAPTPRMAALAPPPPPAARPPRDGAPSPAKPRLGGGASPSSVPRPAPQGDSPAPPAPDPRCRTIIVKAQLGEETSHAERLLLRNGCGARR
ncbi:hypothetical protein GCM10009416_21780 [Craurococcus roseus]|uniref:Uncharacterized protein n=1 Tax=Craurococcus roseus TaxID=77585 RepID=A0ABP3Q8Z4_9PROT